MCNSFRQAIRINTIPHFEMDGCIPFLEMYAVTATHYFSPRSCYRFNFYDDCKYLLYYLFFFFFFFSISLSRRLRYDASTPKYRLLYTNERSPDIKYMCLPSIYTIILSASTMSIPFLSIAQVRFVVRDEERDLSYQHRPPGRLSRHLPPSRSFFEVLFFSPFTVTVSVGVMHSSHHPLL